MGNELESAAMQADARQTDFCVYLSAILLIGLLLNAALGWWWADPLAGLIMIPIIAKEGVEGLRARVCCDQQPHFRTLFDPAKAVEKLLHCSERCAVQFLGAVQQLKMHAKLTMQFFCIIADYVHLTTCISLAPRAECADDHVPSGLNRVGYLTNVSYASVWGGQKMEHSAVMPYVIGSMLELGISNIGDEPMDVARGRPWSRFCVASMAIREISKTVILWYP